MRGIQYVQHRIEDLCNRTHDPKPRTYGPRHRIWILKFRIQDLLPGIQDRRHRIRSLNPGPDICVQILGFILRTSRTFVVRTMFVIGKYSSKFMLRLISIFLNRKSCFLWDTSVDSMDLSADSTFLDKKLHTNSQN